MATSTPISGPPASSGPINPVTLTTSSPFRGYAGIHTDLIHAMNYLTNEVRPINPDSNTTCVICNDALQNPVALPDCGHVFCKECIVAWLNPFDREAVVEEGLQVDFPETAREGGMGDDEGGREEQDEEEEDVFAREGHGIVDISDSGVLLPDGQPDSADTLCNKASAFMELFDRLGDRPAPAQEGRPYDHHVVSIRPDEESTLDQPQYLPSNESMVDSVEPGIAANGAESYGQIERLGYLDNYRRTSDDDPLFVDPDDEDDGFWEDH
ncbi:MAG: hypothetical protein Q9183_007870, partial [Haloplaca sp. 2 TL-2023]